MLIVLDVFFHGSGSRSGFSGSDPDFWPIRIRTQKKKFDPDPEKKSGTETLDNVVEEETEYDDVMTCDHSYDR